MWFGHVERKDDADWIKWCTKTQKNQMCHFVFDYNSCSFWLIFILFAAVETGRNAL